MLDVDTMVSGTQIRTAHAEWAGVGEIGHIRDYLESLKKIGVAKIWNWLSCVLEHSGL